MEAVLGKVPVAEMREGDIFIANDPHVAGGTHLPDVNMAMPVFVDGRILAFVCNIAHHADMGGMAPGSMAGGMHEIYQEGLRIPVVRLFSAGKLVQDIFDLVLLNVRVPEERKGDYFAQVAACRLGERRLKEMAGRYGGAVLTEAFQEIVDRTRQRMERAIGTIPPGDYTFADRMDDDGLGMIDIPIVVRISVGNGRVTADFTGSAPGSTATSTSRSTAPPPPSPTRSRRCSTPTCRTTRASST
jgi:N-methylhydantoinase B